MIDCLEFNAWSEKTRRDLEGLAARAALRRSDESGSDTAQLADLLRRLLSADPRRRPSREEIEAVLSRPGSTRA